MAKPRFWLILGALAAVAGVGLYTYPKLPERLGISGVETGRPAKSEPVPDAPATVVEAVAVKVGTVVDELQAVGTLRPDEAVTVDRREILERLARKEITAEEAAAALRSGSGG